MTKNKTKLAGHKKQAARPQRKLRRNMAAKAEQGPDSAAAQVRDATAATKTSNRTTKKQICLELLSRADGASIREWSKRPAGRGIACAGFCLARCESAWVNSWRAILTKTGSGATASLRPRRHRDGAAEAIG